MILSIVATIYNDAQIVPVLVKSILENIPDTVTSYEIILVNDFSKDTSEDAIRLECEKNPCVKGISLSRNFGQQIAMSSGMHHATGDYVIIMDGDMQNPPSEIPRLYSAIQEGYDVVYAVSKTRNNFIDSLTSYVFWALFTRLFNLKIVKHLVMMRIMTKEFMARFGEYAEANRTIDGIVIDISSYYSVLKIENSKRLIGRSNYTFTKRFNLMIDMIISMSNAPLNFLIYLGFFISFGTFIGFLYYLYSYLFDKVPSGYTSTQISIFFFGGLTIFILGIIGRYLSNIYTEVRRRPLYHIKRTYNV